MLLRHVRLKFVPSRLDKVAATCLRCVSTRSTSVIPSSGASPLPDIQIPDVTFTEFVTARFDEFIARQGSDSTPAIVDGISGDARSWRQLRYDIDAVGTALAELGLSSGDVLALVSPNHVDYFSCLHAAAALGAAVNPVNPVLTPVELEALITGCNARMVVAHPDCLPAVEKALARCRGRLQHDDVPLIVFTDADSAADNFTPGAGRVSYDDLRWQGADADAAAPPPPPLPLHAADISPATHVAALPYSTHVHLQHPACPPTLGSSSRQQQQHSHSPSTPPAACSPARHSTAPLRPAHQHSHHMPALLRAHKSPGLLT